ncbi:MAG TPA: UDP-N-acetylmuramate:L-alanyl-gamma-D-glutamyl-meso-diaminopimelate ligase [Candidatus Hydrogenedentes bacterium]|nr:UDP-N-acetylmuramate:L-alanyl-gamma-D-glutamyl-meso-diaminopimelate ligase [Candidatus Hydrogenedentota bacterium]
MPSVHFSGIGGTAMVAGARLALEAGWEVRGSDQALYPPASNMVAALCVPVFVGYDAGNLDWRPDVVVIGNALSRGNPEVETALSRRMRYVSLPEWLKENVLRHRRPVVICGTHGKTTTTALAAHVLDKGMAGTGYLIGGETLGFPHSSRLGEVNAPFVIEGDEYDTAFFDKRAKFLHYLPEIAVVTSLEFDHGDIYRDLVEIETAFRRMLRQIPKEGRLFLCADNHAASLAKHAFSNVATYGFAATADWRGEPHDHAAAPPSLDIWRHNAFWGNVRPPMAGKHNMLNTLASVAVAATLGMNDEAIKNAVSAFPGVRRRMEVFLEHKGVVFVDDFAHHPTAIRETIAAARMRWPERRIRAVFEPRSNTTVTKRFQHELALSFQQAGEVFLGPVHRKESIPEEERLDTRQLASDLNESGVPAAHFEDVPSIVAAIADSICDGDVVLIMSNGAFGGIYAQFRERFAQ